MKTPIQVYPNPSWFIPTLTAELIRIGVEYGRAVLELKWCSIVFLDNLTTETGHTRNSGAEYHIGTRAITLNSNHYRNFVLDGIPDRSSVIRCFLNLWHELTHQQQQENNTNYIINPARFYTDRISYMLEPTEIEARVKSDLIWTMFKNDRLIEKIKTHCPIK